MTKIIIPQNPILFKVSLCVRAPVRIVFALHRALYCALWFVQCRVIYLSIHIAGHRALYVAPCGAASSVEPRQAAAVMHDCRLIAAYCGLLRLIARKGSRATAISGSYRCGNYSCESVQRFALCFEPSTGRYSSQQRRFTAAAVLHSHAAAGLQPLPFTAGAVHSSGSLQQRCFTATPLPVYSRYRLQQGRFTAAAVYSSGASQPRRCRFTAAEGLQQRVYSKRLSERPEGRSDTTAGSKSTCKPLRICLETAYFKKITGTRPVNTEENY